MLNASLKEYVTRRILPTITTPAQYIGGEFNSISKNHAESKGTVCLAFPDTYALGMSHHGMQILYNIMHQRGWACERAFTPLPDMEAALRAHNVPLYSLESFTPLSQFDVVGFSLQYEISYTNVLTMLDLGGIPLHADERTPSDPLIIAGGPGSQNPELLAPFVDLFVIGDGEPSLPMVCDMWRALKDSGLSREDKLAQIASKVDWAYVPRFYEPEYNEDGIQVGLNRTRDDIPEAIRPCVVTDFTVDSPLPTRPIVSFVETAHDRIAIEIMRGCPWQCRFCQSTVIKRPLRYRPVECIVEGALEAYRNTGHDEISLLSLSSSDYPHFEELVKRMSEVFSPLGVKISLPSLRITEMLKKIPALLEEGKRGGLTLAPEVARDDMRQQIRKPINNQDLYDGCREAFKRGWRRVKLYFLCGLPGERPADLDGIVEMAETIARIGKEETGRFADVTASVSNFVPKPHTPYQWNGMQQREYFQWAHRYMRAKIKVRSVTLKCHDVETSLLEGILTRGDRRVAVAIEEVWKRGARLDSWREHFNPKLWWETFEDLGIDVNFYTHRARPTEEMLPWDHIQIKYGRPYLVKEQDRSVLQLTAMAEAV